MENLFVSYEQAIQLKELGMDLGWDNYLQFYDSSTKEFCDVMKDVPAPLKTQVFKWFREKYNIIGLIEGGFDMTNIFTYCIWEGFKDKIYDDYYGTYEEAEDVLINILIDKLMNETK
jgi:hypothetical protein